MRIEKKEVIFLSQKEADTWSDFDKILEGLERECECPNTIILINNIQSYLSDLWEEIEDIE